MRLAAPLLLGTICLASFLGCAPSGPPTSLVKGTISYNGEAIKEGLIYFDNSDAKALSYNALIKDGAFSTALMSGKYKIRVTATKMGPYPAGVVGASGEKEGPQQFIPAKHNEESTLTEEVSGPRELVFNLPK